METLFVLLTKLYEISVENSRIE